ncbi:MAG: phospholipase D-like domain-containing protein [Prosthecobacter sp.]|uniref:phospholipase D-like domain-containing protein n=1 Tax=Prosthecobacter sp. TaxID=1965333 RepID=UPI0039033995
MWLTILITLSASVVLSILLLNLRTSEKQIRYALTHDFTVEDPQFLLSMGQLLGPGILPGNRIKALQNGDQIFPAMLDAIRGAQKTITFETYIYWSGDIGKKFSVALCERARAGVKVHVMLDWVGCGKLEASYLEDMQAAGVEVERYHPIRWHTITRINNRTHRKLLVVDGRIGFTGGVGIADQWTGNAESQDHWRDSHYQLEGPAVAQMQAAFGDNWIKTRAKVLLGPDYYPPLQPIGDSLAQVFKSSRGEGSESVRLMYLLSIASAAKTIRLQAAYFVPDDLAIQTFISARRRDVKIEIIVPGPHTDERIVQSASRSRWNNLLDAGIAIYEYQPTMYHCKVIIVDDVWVSVGSTNFDDRSFRLNDEANLNIYDAAFAAEQVKIFETDKLKSRLMTRSEFKNRSAIGKFFDEIAGTLRRQL